MSSSLKAYLSLSFISALLVVAGYGLAGRQGFVLGAFAAIIVWGLSVSFGDRQIEKTFSGRKLQGQDAWHLEEMLSELSLQARIPRPRLVILNLQVPTALSTGRNWIRGTIYISEGLLKSLSREEIRAVLAHEVACIQRLDTFLYGIASMLSGFLVQFSRAIDGFGKTKKNVLEALLAPLSSLPLWIFVRTSNFYVTDQQAAQILGDPKTLARVLWKLHSCAGAKPLTELPAAAPLFIVSPLTSKNHYRYFERQPPVEKRIERLIGHFPI